MHRRCLWIGVCLSLAGVIVLLSFAGNSRAQGPVAEEPRLGTKIERGPAPFVQRQPSAASVEIQADTFVMIPTSRVVFESYRTGNYEIFIADDDGDHLARLTDNPNADIEPRMTRDGSKIVFASIRFGYQFDIMAMNADGSDVTRLTASSQDDRRPVWSPDGSQILFQTKRDDNWEIYLMNADGSNPTRLTNHPDDDITPNWSPDGSKIVWSAYRNGAYRIWTMNPDGSGSKQLSQQPYSENPAWSQDGSKIAFDADSNFDGWQEIWVMDTDGSNPVMVNANWGSQGNVDYLVNGWAPHFERITFTTVDYIFENNTWYILNASLSYTPVLFSSRSTLISGPNSFDFSPDWQKLDRAAPSSRVNPLPAQTASHFQVSWSGADVGSAGLDSFDIEVRDGLTGTWDTLVNRTSNTSYYFNGWGGHTYYFRSRAWDRAYNVEGWREGYDAFTTVENLPPVSAIDSLPEVSPTNFVVSWSGYDPGGSGVMDYSISYKMDGGNWVFWTLVMGDGSKIFTGNSGHTYAFRACARDSARNEELCPADSPGETQTTVASFGIEGLIIDNLANPVAGALVHSTLLPFQNAPSQVTGSYRTLVTSEEKSITLDWAKDGYGSPPATDFFPLPMVDQLNISLPPQDNAVANPGLEWDGLSIPSWSLGGTMPPAATFSARHTGQNAIRLGAPDTFAQIESIPTGPAGGVKYMLNHLTAPDGVVHAIWLSGEGLQRNLLYTRRDVAGVWSAPLEIVHQQPGLPRDMVLYHLAIGPDGTLHLLWRDDSQQNLALLYMQRSPLGAWSVPIAVVQAETGPKLKIIFDRRGVMNVAWYGKVLSTGRTSFYLLRRNPGGDWTAPIDICKDYPYSSNQYNDAFDSFFIGLHSNDTLSFLWQDQSERIIYRSLSVNGNWSEEKIIVPNFLISGFEAQIDSNGIIHLVLSHFTQANGSMLYGLQIAADASWSSPVSFANVGDLEEFHLVVDKNNAAHVVWEDQVPPYAIYYAVQPAGGAWSAPQTVSSVNRDSSYSLSLAVDRFGKPVIAWNQQGSPVESVFKIVYAQKTPNGWATPRQFASPFNAKYDDLSLTCDDRGWINLAWFDSSDGKAYFSSMLQTVGPAGGSAELSQAIMLSPTLAAAVVAFDYQFNQATLLNAAHLDVSVVDGAGAHLLGSFTSNTVGWSHAWLDVSPWIGQAITLRFSFSMAAGQAPAYVLLDDISLGSTSPDVWAASYQAGPAFPGRTVTLHLMYGNRGGPPVQDVRLTATLPLGLTFQAADLAPTQVNGQALTWQLGELAGQSGAFTIQVTAALTDGAAFFDTLEGSLLVETPTLELETTNNQAPLVVFVGARQLMPVVTK